MEKEIFVLRTEKKYEITREQKIILMNKLEKILKMDKGYREGYLVRSLYFDGIQDDDYFEKLDGLEKRKKIRIRTYDPNLENVKLEIKKKEGDVQQKKTVWISKNLAKEIILGEFSGLLEIGSVVAEEIYNIMETEVYRPKCIIEYNRSAFIEETNNTRVTFDSDIRVSHDFDKFFENEIITIPVKDEPVLEVKYNDFLLSNVKHIVDEADVQQTSVSKYVLSREVLWI